MMQSGAVGLWRIQRGTVLYLQDADELLWTLEGNKEKTISCMCVSAQRNIREADDSHEGHHCRWE